MSRKILLLSTLIGLVLSADAQNYLTLTAETDGSTFMLTQTCFVGKTILEYSTNGKKWMTLGMDTEIELPKAGDKAMLKGENDGLSNGQDAHTQFVMTGKIAASGSVMSLIDGKGESLEIPDSHCFYGLFENCASLTKAPELSATKLSEYCYGNMFSGCTSLKEAPELPAKEVVALCYDHMFTNCTSLEKAPKLPAKIVYMNSYSNMFKGCTALTEAPELPAETLGEKCYWDMFKNCKSLKRAPNLPASELKSECYHEMFLGCDNLENKDYADAISKAKTVNVTDFDEPDDWDFDDKNVSEPETSNENVRYSIITNRIIEELMKSNKKSKTKGKTTNGVKYKVVLKKKCKK